MAMTLELSQILKELTEVSQRFDYVVDLWLGIQNSVLYYCTGFESGALGGCW